MAVGTQGALAADAFDINAQRDPGLAHRTGSLDGLLLVPPGGGSCVALRSGGRSHDLPLFVRLDLA